MAAASGISTGGKAFFGSLCASTFGLGCWQVQRLYEKVEKIDDRQNQLQMSPTNDWENEEHPYRRRLVSGSFRHDKEVLIGPRGAPPGVSLPRQGLSAKQAGSGQSSGMAPGPQGYFVLTPMELQGKKTAWINRGWVPKTMVPDARRGPATGGTWSRPKGTISLTTVRSSPEKPKIITPQHDYSKRPLQLFWFDPLALQAIAESEEEISLLAQVVSEEEADESSAKSGALYPLRPPVASVADFKTTPAIHAGYAATWFGLSGAGIYMTRKLITRGRG
eukprot:CAMPEP_0113647090 /NCGR_PEP_ID=MMETSP0017_2-20120614/24908_1 /TAXON_ID=2856 /ORGANISM="Cylindrotheca closterium" /LENGTH=276 /DNA_ID=CAMNT_0000559089 /DNA_START=38 /DNA_END=868 /DNA_ORIENTATION=+ /assembly_acc=CAM_ASM_000147